LGRLLQLLHWWTRFCSVSPKDKEMPTFFVVQFCLVALTFNSRTIFVGRAFFDCPANSQDCLLSLRWIHDWSRFSGLRKSYAIIRRTVWQAADLCGYVWLVFTIAINSFKTYFADTRKNWRHSWCSSRPTLLLLCDSKARLVWLNWPTLTIKNDSHYWIINNQTQMIYIGQMAFYYPISTSTVIPPISIQEWWEMSRYLWTLKYCLRLVGIQGKKLGAT